MLLRPVNVRQEDSCMNSLRGKENLRSHLCKAMEVNTDFQSRPQDGEDTKAMGYLPKRAQGRK